MTEHSTEIALPPEILNPLTGELVPTSDLGRVTEAVEQLRSKREQITAAINAFNEPLIVESQRIGKKTLIFGGLKAKISSDHEIEWDIEVLLELRDRGLPEERYGELVTETVSYKVNGSVAREIAGAKPEYAEVIARAKKQIPKKQYVSIG